MIYDFIYQNPPKATRSAKITSVSRPLDAMKAAYRNKYGTDMEEDGYTGYLLGASTESSTGTDADGGAKGPKPSIVDFISWGGKVIDDETKFYDGDESPTLYEAVNGKYRKRDEESRAKEIISEAFEDIDRPDRYLQGEIDLIDAAYLLFPWDQFKGFMKITIMRYTLRYEHKGWLKDLDKITVYTRRLKELEVKNKEREDRKNEK